MSEVAEAQSVLRLLRHTFEDLAVAGLRTGGPGQLTSLRNLEQELSGIGVPHLASRVAAVADAIESDSREAAANLMLAQASMRSFERLLTLENATAKLGTLIAEDDGEGEEVGEA